MIMWPEIEIAKKERRREVVLSGTKVNNRIHEHGLDKSLFSLTELNYLSLTETSLSKIPCEILELENLQTLILHSNKLEYVHENVFKLSKLKILDLSSNLLSSLPENISLLSQLVSLNLSYNKFDSFSISFNNSKLATLDISNNNLKLFPNICTEQLTSLSELKLHGNKIEEIPSNIDILPSLKIMDLSENNIKTIPGELGQCHKLKEVNLKSNPISDKRLKKLIDQCRTKQVIDYVKQHCLVTNKGNSDNKNLENGKKTSKDERKIAEDEHFYRYNIRVKPANENIKVVIDNSVKPIREHIVCCILNDIVFTEEIFKKFIQLQNKLHDKVCDKRNLATIATHDLKKLGDGIIKYTTFPPNELKIKPLNRASEMSGAELFSKLQNEANNLRKEKKRNTYSGIHKYLYLIEGRPVYPCLLNKEGNVISFPPITNSDISKIEVSTTDIFIEVTSTASQNTCKNILSEILKETVSLFEKNLQIQQIKVLDSDEKLKVLFPSKNDLNFNPEASIKIIRE